MRAAQCVTVGSPAALRGGAPHSRAMALSASTSAGEKSSPPASALRAAAANRACMLESAAAAVEGLAAFLAREGPGVDMAGWAAAVRRHVGLG